jgi:hypothetical protein
VTPRFLPSGSDGSERRQVVVHPSRGRRLGLAAIPEDLARRGYRAPFSAGCLSMFGSDRTPGVAPQGVFRSRTVSTTVAKWFVPIARGTVDKVYRFGPLRDA